MSMEKETFTEQKLPSYGGQALIEGVLMRGSRHAAAALRAPDGSVLVVHEELKGIYKTNLHKIPFLRGLILLWDSLGLGMKFLIISANAQTEEKEKFEGFEVVMTMIVSLAFSIGLFFLAPAGIALLLEKLVALPSWVSHIVEGFVRLSIVVGYMAAVSRIEEIKRVFRYHGAEHKTINCFDSGEEVTLENVRKQSRLHPRCGTAFMVTVVFISIVLFLLIGPLTKSIAARLISRLILVPVIAGVSYEYIRWNAKHMNRPFIKFLYRPNLAVQNITTAEPDDAMLEIAIRSFKTMLAYEGGEIPEGVLETSELDGEKAARGSAPNGS